MALGIGGALGTLVGSAVMDRFGAQAVWRGCLVLGAVTAALLLGTMRRREQRIAGAEPDLSALGSQRGA